MAVAAAQDFEGGRDGARTTARDREGRRDAVRATARDREGRRDAAAATARDVGAAPAGQRRSGAAAEALLLEVVRRHADELLRIAGQHSLCADDAHDAYQRSLEQFLKCGSRLERATAHKWLFTVIKREALMIRAARNLNVGLEEVDVDRIEALHDASPEDRALEVDAVARGAEALRALKPQELRALWLRADGRSYAEIQATTGWTYTKVNRSLREGRRAYLRRCAELEAGTACAAWRDALTEVAAGEARAAQLVTLRPHLRRCAACRATLRGLHASRASVATVLPAGLVGVGVVGRAGAERHVGALHDGRLGALHDGRLGALRGWLGRAHDAVLGAVSRAHDATVGPLHDRAVAGAVRWQAAAEVVSSGKVAVVAASTVALAGGGAVVAHEAPTAAHRASAHRASAPHPRRSALRRATVAAAPARPVPRIARPAATPRAVAVRAATSATTKQAHAAPEEFAARTTSADASGTGAHVASAEFGGPAAGEPVVGTAAVASKAAAARSTPVAASRRAGSQRTATRRATTRPASTHPASTPFASTRPAAASPAAAEFEP